MKNNNSVCFSIPIAVVAFGLSCIGLQSAAPAAASPKVNQQPRIIAVHHGVTHGDQPTKLNNEFTIGAILSMSAVTQVLPTSAYFLYGTDPNLQYGTIYRTTDADTRPDHIPETGKPFGITATVIKLRPNTTYYYRGVVSNKGGQAQSPIQSFTTPAKPATAGSTPPKVGSATDTKVPAKPPGGPPPLPNPTVVRAWDSAVTDSSATLSMEVINDGLPSKVSFLYGTDPNLAGAVRTAEQSVGEMPIRTPAQRHASLMNLKPNTKYYYKAVLLSSEQDRSESKINSFMTRPVGPAPAKK